MQPEWRLGHVRRVFRECVEKKGKTLDAVWCRAARSFGALDSYEASCRGFASRLLESLPSKTEDGDEGLMKRSKDGLKG